MRDEIGAQPAFQGDEQESTFVSKSIRRQHDDCAGHNY